MIEGQVADVLSPREIIINRGQQHGVTSGMQFDVVAGEPRHVTDPATGKSLGAFHRAKMTVIATTVHELFSVCGAVEENRQPWSPIDIFSIRRKAASTVRAEEVSAPLSPHESMVRVGDRVLQAPNETTLRPKRRA